MDIFKKSQVWGFFLSMAVMAIISLVYFYPDNFEGNSLMQADMQQGAANGHEGQLYEEATGEKALWTNALFSGMPTFQISPSYPSNSLFTWLNKVYGLFLPSPSNLLFMMMFGFLILLYCMGLRWYYALIGAVAWGFSSYFIIIIGAGHIWKFVALSYIPPTIGGIVLCYRKRYLLGGALAALFAMLQLNANHPQMTYYFAFVIIGFVIVYLIQAFKEKKVRDWAVSSSILVGAALLAVGANLPSLYNTYEYSKETKRAQSELTPLPSATQEGQEAAPAERPTGGLPKGDIVNWSYGGSEMMSLLVPNIKGGASAISEKGQMRPMTLDGLEAAQDAPYDVQPYLAVFTQYFNDSEGTNGPVYVGALICALFLLGCIIVRGPMKWCLVVLTLLSMLLALGRNFEALTDFMIYNFPMYNKFRAVESILVVAEFTMPLLAILALAQYLDKRRDTDNRALQALYISFGICGVLCLVALIAPGVFGEAINSQDRYMMERYNISPTPQLLATIEDLRYGMVRDDALRSLIFILIGFFPLLLYRLNRCNRATCIAVVGGVVLIDLFVTDKRYVSHDNFALTDLYAQASFDPFAEDGIDKAILADTTSHYRVLDIPGFGDATRSYHHSMIGGYHAAKLNRYEDLISRRMNMYMSYVYQTGYLPQPMPDSIRMLYPKEDQEVIKQLDADSRVMNMLNAKYIITGNPDYPLLLNSDALGNAWLVDEVKYVTCADDEMAALGTLDPAHQAVADRKFMEALGSDFVRPVPGDTIYLTSYSPNRLTYHVNTAGGGIGVFSEVYFPWGWKASIDGHPTELARVNYVLRALKIPAGSHTISMTFDPDSIHATGAVAYACVSVIYLLLLLAIFVSVRPGKRAPAAKDSSEAEIKEE